MGKELKERGRESEDCVGKNMRKNLVETMIYRTIYMIHKKSGKDV